MPLTLEMGALQEPRGKGTSCFVPMEQRMLLNGRTLSKGKWVQEQGDEGCEGHVGSCVISGAVESRVKQWACVKTAVGGWIPETVSLIMGHILRPVVYVLTVNQNLEFVCVFACTYGCVMAHMCMCACLHVCMCEYASARVPLYGWYVFMPTCIHSYLYVHTCALCVCSIHMFMAVYLLVYICMYMCLPWYMCICPCTCVWLCVCLHSQRYLPVLIIPQDKGFTTDMH